MCALCDAYVPCKVWRNGSAYSTRDHVFIPSTTELNDDNHEWTYDIGRVYAFFAGMGNAKRVARIDGNTWYYWTRSPVSGIGGGNVRVVLDTGGFYYNYYYDIPDNGLYAVRPVLNMKSEILVSGIKP